MIPSRPPAPRRIALFVLALVVAAPLSANAAIRIGVGSRLAAAPLHVAAARGYFEREGVEVELVALAETDDTLELVLDGELELATASADFLLRAETYGVELRGAYLLALSGAADAIVAREDIGDTRRLAGRRVAFAPESAGEVLLRYALQLKGRRLGNVEAVPLAPEAAARALVAGEVDAAVLAEPVLSMALAEADDVEVLATAAARQGLVSDLLAGEERWLDEEKEAVKDIIRALDRAVAWMRRRPAEATTLVAEAFDITPDRVARALEGLELLGVEDNMQLLRGEFQKAFSAMSEVLATGEDGRPREVPSANRYLDLSALRQVAARR